MIGETGRLATPLRRALLYVVERLAEVGVTKLEKTLYLADLEHVERHGRPITDATWVRYHYGPMAKDVKRSTDVMQGHEVLVSLEQRGTRQMFIYRPGPDLRFTADLGVTESAVLDRIISMVRPLTTQQITDLAYSTTPMKVVLRSEEQRDGEKELDRVLDLSMTQQQVAAVARYRPKSERAARA